MIGKGIAPGILFGLFLVIAGSPVYASTIRFDGAPPPGGTVLPGTPYTEAGFTFTSSLPGPTSAIFDSASSVTTNGTDVFGWCASDCGATQVITVTGRGLFSLSQIDVGALTVAAPGMSVNLVGHFADGRSIVVTLPVAQSWVTHTLVGFTNLSSLTITAVDPSPAALRDSAIDNLVITDVVSRPTSLAFVWLVALGCAASFLGLSAAALAPALRPGHLAVSPS